MDGLQPISTRYSDEELATLLTHCREGREDWRQHPDYREITVSNLGGVQRLGRPLQPHPGGKGKYPTVTIRGLQRRVHHLVLETFIGPRPPGTECCHWDGDNGNAILYNLRWDTPEANREDSRRHRIEQGLPVKTRPRRLTPAEAWRARVRRQSESQEKIRQHVMDLALRGELTC